MCANLAVGALLFAMEHSHDFMVLISRERDVKGKNVEKHMHSEQEY